MKYMNWMNLFRSHILDRGIEYYEDDKVTGLMIDDSTIVANVEGTYTYDVSIVLDGEDIIEMSCDCPYASDGHNCKHMAAVLFAYEGILSDEEAAHAAADSDFDDYSGEAYLNQQQKEAEQLIEKIPEADLRKMLIRFVLRDASLKNQLQLKYDFRMNAKQMTVLKNEVFQTVRDYGGRSGYIDWYHASEFLSELEMFLDAKIPMLLEHGCVMQAFELTNLVFHEIGNVDIDDSDGGMMQVADKCSDYWIKILELCSIEEKDEIHKWFVNHLSDYVIDFMQEYMEEFVEETFPSEEQLRDRIRQLDKIIENHSEGNDCGIIYSSYKGCENVLLKRMECMRRLGMGTDEIRKFRKEHRHFFSIRELEINEAFEKGDFKEAERVLLESKELDAAYPEQVKKYSEQLIEFYKKEERVCDYKKELLFQLTNCDQSNLKYYIELKKCHQKNSVEWEATVDEIIKCSKNSYFLCKVYAEEKRYSDLMHLIEKDENVFWLDEYEKILKKVLPERVIALYSKYILSEMERANDRKRYRYLVQYLKKIDKIENGKEEAENIAHRWRIEYKRRTALMDELRKAGF